MKDFTGNVLALDLATVTGWAYGRPGAVPIFGHLRFVIQSLARWALSRVPPVGLIQRGTAIQPDLDRLRKRGDPLDHATGQAPNYRPPSPRR